MGRNFRDGFHVRGEYEVRSTKPIELRLRHLKRVSYFVLRSSYLLPSGLVGIETSDQFRIPFVQQGPIDGTGAEVGHVLVPRQPVDGGLQ